MQNISLRLEKNLSKKRIDEVLVEKGLFKSRSEARRFIIEGKILLNGQLVQKAGTLVKDEDQIILKEGKKYVSRGGLKLEFAIDQFGIDPKGLITSDIGTSTGGFTDFLLKRGVKRVYDVDVGYGQFDYSLRNDKRVILLERTNARYLTQKEIPEQLDLIVMDVSFISIVKILPALTPLMKEESSIISLIKPQFEGKREYLKKGIVKDKGIHKEILFNLIDNISRIGLCVTDATYSPVKGKKGNIEFFFLIKKHGKLVNFHHIYKIVDEVWERMAR